MKFFLPRNVAPLDADGYPQEVRIALVDAGYHITIGEESGILGSLQCPGDYKAIKQAIQAKLLEALAQIPTSEEPELFECPYAQAAREREKLR